MADNGLVRGLGENLEALLDSPVWPEARSKLQKGGLLYPTLPCVLKKLAGPWRLGVGCRNRISCPWVLLAMGSLLGVSTGKILMVVWLVAFVSAALGLLGGWGTGGEEGGTGRVLCSGVLSFSDMPL